jgi:hypothetical protein
MKPSHGRMESAIMRALVMIGLLWIVCSGTGAVSIAAENTVWPARSTMRRFKIFVSTNVIPSQPGWIKPE